MHVTSVDETPGQEMLPDEGLTSTDIEHRRPIPGRKTATVELSGYLTGSNDALGDGASTDSTPEWGAGVLLKTIMKGYSETDGALEDGGTASTASVVTPDSAGPWSDGSAMGVVISGSFEARPCDVGGGDLSLDIPLSAAPADGAEIFGPRQFYFDDDPNQSLQLVVEGPDRDGIHWYRGGQATGLSFELTPNGLVTYSTSLQFADWYHDNDVGTPVGAGAIAESTPDGSDPISWHEGTVVLTPNAAPLLTEVCHAGLSIELNFGFQPIPAVSGTNGIKRWRFMPAKPLVSGTITLIEDSTETEHDIETYEDARDAGTRYSLMVQVGATAGATWLFYVPDLVFTGVRPVDAGGLAGIELTYEGLHDADAAGNRRRTNPLRLFAL